MASSAAATSARLTKASSPSRSLDVRAVADANAAAAEARGAEFGVPAVPEALSPILPSRSSSTHRPLAHVEWPPGGRAGKHVHSSSRSARRRRGAAPHAAAARGVRVGSAPDTFLGGGIQTARQLLDDGVIGRPLAVTANMLCRGHESWHPAPEFYYKRGGGPMFDMGPYYVTALVNLLGPVGGSAITARARPVRTITSQPLAGTTIPVEVATHAAATLAFQSGPIVTMVMSFDVPRHRHRPIELYGSEGSMAVPDPNCSRADRDGTAAGDWCLRSRSMPIQRQSRHRRRRHGPRDLQERPHKRAALAPMCWK
jgi:hypothetical protein